MTVSAVSDHKESNQVVTVGSNRDTVLCAKRGENGLLHTLGIMSVILHAIHTQDIST